MEEILAVLPALKLKRYSARKITRAKDIYTDRVSHMMKDN